MLFQVRRILREFAFNDDAQDVIEYALLTAAIGLVSAATWPLIVTQIGVTYQNLDARTQGLWEVPPPQ